MQLIQSDYSYLWQPKGFVNVEMFPIRFCDFFYAKCIASENNPFNSKPEELVWSHNKKFVKLFFHPSHSRCSQK